MLGQFSRITPSGTAEHPTPRSLIEDLIGTLTTSSKWGWITVETKSKKHFVEVARERDGELEINISYFFPEDYKRIFADKQIEIPDGWRVKKFKKKGWFGTGTMLLETDSADIGRVANFIQEAFLRLYNEPQDYQLFGHLSS